MSPQENAGKATDSDVALAAHYSLPEEGATAAWEQIAAGRYMPRRIKGSCKGRALG